MEKKRLEDKAEKVRGELAEVTERGAMGELVDKYLMSGDQETQKVCYKLTSSSHLCSVCPSHLTYVIVWSIFSSLWYCWTGWMCPSHL